MLLFNFFTPFFFLFLIDCQSQNFFLLRRPEKQGKMFKCSTVVEQIVSETVCRNKIFFCFFNTFVISRVTHKCSCSVFHLPFLLFILFCRFSSSVCLLIKSSGLYVWSFTSLSLHPGHPFPLQFTNLILWSGWKGIQVTGNDSLFWA